MFIARPDSNPSSAVWGGLPCTRRVTKTEIRPPQTAEEAYSSDASITMPLLTELPLARLGLAMGRLGHRIFLTVGNPPKTASNSLAASRRMAMGSGVKKQIPISIWSNDSACHRGR